MICDCHFVPVVTVALNEATASYWRMLIQTTLTCDAVAEAVCYKRVHTDTFSANNLVHMY
jgi:hypothetical protein